MADELTISQLRSLMESQRPGAAAELKPAAGPAGPSGASEPEGASFADMLKESIAEVNDLKIEADQAIEDLATGKTGDLQGTILALEKADVSFKMMMEVRSKILSAYQEVMRTQV